MIMVSPYAGQDLTFQCALKILFSPVLSLIVNFRKRGETRIFKETATLNCDSTDWQNRAWQICKFVYVRCYTLT